LYLFLDGQIATLCSLTCFKKYIILYYLFSPYLLKIISILNGGCPVANLSVDLRNTGIYLNIGMEVGKVLEARIQHDELVVLLIQPINGKPVYNRLMMAASRDGSLNDKDRFYIEDFLFRYSYCIASAKSASAKRLERALRKNKQKRRGRRIKKTPRDFRPLMADEDKDVIQADRQCYLSYISDSGLLKARLLEGKLKQLSCK
jgi:hypothetical protein